MIFYATFGQWHLHPVTKERMKDYWIEIEAKTQDIAADIMNKMYGLLWSCMYQKEQWQPQHYPKGCYQKFKEL